MWVLGKKITPWNESLYFAGKVARQKLSKYYAEVTPMTSLLLKSAQIHDSFRKIKSFRKSDKAMDIDSEDEMSYTSQYLEACLKYVENETRPNINECPSMKTKMFCPAISSPLHWLLDLFNRLLIHMICSGMWTNTWCLNAWLNWHPNEVIVQHAYWLVQGFIWIHRLNHQRTGGKLIQIFMITTPTRWGLAVHFGFRISLTGSARKRIRTQRTPIPPMVLAT